jgi:putative ABC transport system permease protein
MPYKSISMLFNHIKVAWRNLFRNKIFSLINFAGLVISLTACAVITLYIIDELSFDRFHKNAARIVRVVSHAKWDVGKIDITGTSGKLGEALKNASPMVEDFVRLNPEGGGVINTGSKKIKENAILLADRSFFQIFSYEFLLGDASTALKNDRSIVITNQLATTLFGSSSEALGKTVTIDGSDPVTVTAIVNDPPANAHFGFAAIRPIPQDFDTDWQNLSMYTYLLLRKPTDIEKFTSILPTLVKDVVPGHPVGDTYRLEAQPLTRIHLHSKVGYELGTNGDLQFLWMLAAVGLLILLIAVVNYANLTTARASVRVREVAIRKVIGSGQRTLIQMFLTESVILVFLAIVMTGLIVVLALPFFSMVTGKSLPLRQFSSMALLIGVICFGVLMGFIGGIYPAVFLSRLKMLASLKGQIGKQAGQAAFRKSLVVFQFAVTVIMIVCSLVIFRQLNYVSNKDLGFDKNGLVTIHLDNRKTRAMVPAIERALVNNPSVQGAAAAGNPIGNNDIGMGEFNAVHDGVTGTRSELAYMLQVDENFIPTMRLHLADGRNFDPSIRTDSTSSIIINETLALKEGWKHPIGERILAGTTPEGVPQYKTVIGVIKDFSIFSLQHKIEPLILELPALAKDKDNLYIRVAAKNLPATMRYIETTLRSFEHDILFDYRFIDQNFAAQYKTDEKQGAVMFLFTLLTVAVACLGLLGLVTFSAEQRVKEIGIRKVLGASITNIITLLSKDFVVLVLVSLVVSIPVAYWLSTKWLQTFAYRISVDWWLFVIAAIGALLIALCTLAVQGYRAARANPTKILKTV